MHWNDYRMQGLKICKISCMSYELNVPTSLHPVERTLRTAGRGVKICAVAI